MDSAAGKLRGFPVQVKLGCSNNACLHGHVAVWTCCMFACWHSASVAAPFHIQHSSTGSYIWIFMWNRSCDRKALTSTLCIQERQCTSCFSCAAGFGSIAQSHPSRFWTVVEARCSLYRVRFNKCVLMFVITWFPSLNVHKWVYLQNWQAKRS